MPTTRIETLLVANRGEIARRVIRTCRDLGITTVAVYSDADATAPHVDEADLAVRLPGTAPADTYLRADLLVAAARATGADALHPGYGFLSESAAFAADVLAAGVTWIGPSPEAISRMGAKIEAKRLLAEEGLPVLRRHDPHEVTEELLPVLVKASAGGGGRGIRVVTELAGLERAVASAGAEAAAAFGDPAVFCERYVRHGRHVEVQVLADTHGTVWTLGERDCSVQRRHQKIIEETPAPGLHDRLRTDLAAAATRTARSVGYVGTGTVEFLVEPDGAFWILEMNTRLQVEHPVTECVTGLDLVAWQVRVAEGARLPADAPALRGHAVEARLYAEDPAAGWRPSPGALFALDVPGVRAEFAPLPEPGVRLDAGVRGGAQITTSYDPMLAKVIAWAPDRGEAIRRLAATLRRTRLHGVTTNRDLLVRILTSQEFTDAELHTGFLDGPVLADLARPLADAAATRLSALAAALADAEANRERAEIWADVPSGWRNLPSQPQVKGYRDTTDTDIEVRYRHTRAGLRVENHPGIILAEASPRRVVLIEDGVRRAFDVTAYQDLTCVDSGLGAVRLVPLDRFPDPAARLDPGTLLAPMPGTVRRVVVAAGDTVEFGQPLLWMEAMKMEHRVTAPVAGVVSVLEVGPGAQVEAGAVLAVVDPRP
ncbi:acetyl/propionyl/methylcrotonyl-CoA carboxylase subunit alpha [Nocardiopsis ansamitocini]|uniref:acetyl/propionyl/methylcrotonyl-CoA carboxylase subunit alpha n=1 Tax=Nocardiopsis ansamitocini TaxID=1670832 RepID=UPI00255304B9|nr:biotin carboxylase N-terminal domain-containing protein [Nocardiopsis ansamitocini]